MSDAAIRELERAARSGDPQAEERLLVARLRAVTIEVWRLHLADAAGSGAAARALGRPPLVIQLGPLLSHVENLMRAEESRAQAKSAGVLAACCMVEVAQRHHHASRRGVFRVGEPAHRTLQRASRAGHERPALQAPRARRFTDVSEHTLDTCSDVTCDLAIRCVDAARAWVTSRATRRDEEALCFSLASMVARTGAYGYPLHPFQRHQLEGLDWPAVPCAMVAHEGGRPDLLARLHERVRRLPFDAITPRGHNSERRLEADELEAAVKLDLELRAAVGSALIAWALA